MAVVGSGGTFGWMAVRNASWNEIRDGVLGLDWWILLLALAAVMLAGVLDTLRWRLLLPSERVPLFRLFLVRNVGQGLNNISPVRVMAEVAQTAMLRYRNGVRTEKVVSSLVIGKLLDLIVTLNLVGVGLVFVPQISGLRPVVFPLWIIASASLIGLMFMNKWAHRIPYIRRFRACESVIRSMTEVSLNRRCMIYALAVTSLAWLSIGVAAWLVAGALGIDCPSG